MFITIYKLDIEKPLICKALTDVVFMHRQVQKMFNAPRCEHQVLWYTESGYLMIKSDIAPVYEGIFGNGVTHNVSKMADAWTEGDRFRFRIRTSPSRSVHGKLHYRKTAEERKEWISRQFLKHGAIVVSCNEISKSNNILTGKENKKDGGNSSFTSWNYNGVLEIKDAERFKELYRNGMGSEKAYGSGMLVLS